MKIKLCHVSNSSSMNSIVIGRQVKYPIFEELIKLVEKDKLYACGDGVTIDDDSDFFPVNKSMLKLWKKHYIDDLTFYDVDYIDRSDSIFVEVPKSKLPEGDNFSVMAVDISKHFTKTIEEFKKRYIHED